MFLRTRHAVRRASLPASNPPSTETPSERISGNPGRVDMISAAETLLDGTVKRATLSDGKNYHDFGTDPGICRGIKWGISIDDVDTFFRNSAYITADAVS